jgi:hypothetical protein
MLDLLTLEVTQNIVNCVSAYDDYSEECLILLKGILGKQKREEFKGIYEEEFENILEAMAGDGNQFQAVLRMMRMISIAVENYEHKEHESSIKRTGAEFVDLFFDLLNFWSGYHPLRNYEAEGAEYMDPYLAIDGLDVIDFTEKLQSQNWVEHLFLRTYSINNNRNHFPVAITTTKNYFFSTEILEKTNVSLSSLAIIDLQT